MKIGPFSLVSGLFYLLLFTGCHSGPATLFKKIPSSHSGITFNNIVAENDSINPLDMEFLYNGGGVAIGDFNNDGLPDLYFTASTTSNKLYLNKGNLSFKDITEEAKVTGEKRWANAASVVDINNDGWEDIYVSNSIKTKGAERKNLLYINQGLNKDKVPVFREMAEEYGLADTSFSVHAAFFDYDNDGDLDMYLVTTRLAKREASSFSDNKIDTNYVDVDKLFRNDPNPALNHPVFTDVSKGAGIIHRGYGLGISVADINRDGWKDIYVTNDFFTSDVLYLNNHDGTFTNKVNDYFKHTSQNAMGNDIADINNDGLADVMTVDMNPEDNYRKKKNMSGNNYFLYQNMLYTKLTLQYVRNTLQLNMGPRALGNDSVGEPVFGDIGFLTNTAETDWSWTPSLADFDNDGFRDILVTNGYPRDVTDHDFTAFRGDMGNVASKEELLDAIPQIKVPNYAFRNKGALQFQNITKEWGLDEPSFSAGAAYVDLDNDGDLDYVVSNINEESFLYENTVNSKEKTKANFLEISFKGDKNNLKGLGAWAEIYYGGKLQVYENLPYRGYLSTLDTRAFFGLDSVQSVDSLIIRWPGNKKQKLVNVKSNQLLTVGVQDANLTDDWRIPLPTQPAFFKDATAPLGINYVHREMDFIDFNFQRLLPHKLSQYGPGLAAADVDGNGLDDIYIGGTGDFPGTFLLQQKDGRFVSKEIPLPIWPDVRRPENLGVLLFDADNDGDLDLYCASGSNEFAPGTKNYQDQFFSNDGKGNFLIDTTVLPKNYTSKSCIKAADIDNDGDLDLFLGGRVMPGKYPMPVSSYIYRNDSKPGNIKFTDITSTAASELKDIGLVCDALWTDFDNDGAIDLIVTGEWMPISFFKNVGGKFQNITAGTGLKNEVGWWNSIAGGDFDNDGDIDYIAGNLGTNSFYRATKEHPVRIYAKDFDKNGSYDAIPVVYLKDQKNQWGEFTAQNRDDILEQLPVLRKRFLTYKEYADADIRKVFSEAELKDAKVYQANNFQSCFIRNEGGGKFSLHPLPVAAQVAPLYGLVVDDFNGDGNLDLAATGNDFGTEVSNGRYDALNGVVLLGDGYGGFAAQTLLHSGLFIPGDGKALIKLRGANDNYLLAASQNNGPLKVFSSNKKTKTITLDPADKMIFITLQNGQRRKEEVYWGNSFLSQSARFLEVNDKVKKIEIISGKGEKRQLGF